MLQTRRSVSTNTNASQIGLPWSPSLTPGEEPAGQSKLQNNAAAGLVESKGAVYSQHEQHMPHNLRISINDNLPQFSDGTSVESETSPSDEGATQATHPTTDAAMLQLIAQKKRAKLMGMALLLVAGIHVGCAVGYFVADIPAGFLARGIAYGSVHGALALLAGFTGVYALLHRRSMHWSYLIAGLACVAVALVTTSVMQSCLSGPYNNLFGHCSSGSDSYALMAMVLIGILSCCFVLRTRQQLVWYVRLGLASAIATSSVAAMVVMWALKHGGTTTNFVFMVALLVATYTWLIYSGMREVVVIPLGGVNPEMLSPIKVVAPIPNFPVGTATKELAVTFEALASKIVKPLREVSHAISALSADVQDCVTKDSSISSVSRQVLDDDMKELVGLAVQLRQLIEAWNIQRAREYRKRLLRRVLAAVVAGTTPPGFNIAATPLTPAAPAFDHVPLDDIAPQGGVRHPAAVPTDATVAEVVHHVPDSSGANWLVNTAAEHLIHHVKHPSPHYAEVSAHAQTLPFELSSDPNLVAKAVQQTLLQRYATAHSPQSIVARVAGTPRMHQTLLAKVTSGTPPAGGELGPTTLLSPTKPPRPPPRNVPAPIHGSPAASNTNASINTASHHNKSMSPLSWSLSSDSNSSPSTSSGEYCSTCGELLSSGSESSSSSGSPSPRAAEADAIHPIPSTGAADLVGGQVDPQNKSQTQHEADYSRPDDTYAFDYGFEHEYGHKYKKKNPQHAQHILTGKRRESTEKPPSPDQSLSASLGVSSMAPTLIHGRMTDASAVILGVPSEPDLVASAQMQPPAIVPAPGFASPMSDTAHAAVLSPQHEQNEAQFHFGLHVLVVDDERVNRRIAERFLQQLGCTCTCAADGDEIVEALVVSERPFDVILLDVIMKRTNGIEVCKNLREQHVDIPIIAATANYSHKEAAIYRAAGFDRVLQKPFSMKDLASAVAQALGIQIGRGAALNYSKAP
jgi:CheY-like chemotaxis protein